MNNFKNVIQFANIIAAIILVIVIMLQNKSSGLSNVFGGGGGIVQTRRGFEKVLFYATIVIGVIFVSLNVAALLLSR